MIVVGIDPGGQFAGVVTRDDSELVEHSSLVRGKKQSLAAWVGNVGRTVAWHVERNATDLVAIEAVKAPSPHLGLTNVGPLLDTAAVVGAVLRAHPDAQLVKPARHGTAPLGCYPPALVGPREIAGTGGLRHCRSAWDIAGRAAADQRRATREPIRPAAARTVTSKTSRTNKR